MLHRRPVRCPCAVFACRCLQPAADSRLKTVAPEERSIPEFVSVKLSSMYICISSAALACHIFTSDSIQEAFTGQRGRARPHAFFGEKTNG